MTRILERGYNERKNNWNQKIKSTRLNFLPGYFQQKKNGKFFWRKHEKLSVLPLISALDGLPPYNNSNKNIEPLRGSDAKADCADYRFLMNERMIAKSGWLCIFEVLDRKERTNEMIMACGSNSIKIHMKDL
jgi:hypothetical protein